MVSRRVSLKEINEGVRLTASAEGTRTVIV
jgi:hypothetical protein